MYNFSTTVIKKMNALFFMIMKIEKFKTQVKGQLTSLSDLTKLNDHEEITKVSACKCKCNVAEFNGYLRGAFTASLPPRNVLSLILASEHLLNVWGCRNDTSA